jgi:hypothetical protein
MKLLEFEPDAEDMRRYSMLKNAKTCWVSDDNRYFVSLNHVNGFIHVRIMRRDCEKMENWAAMQEIKNQTLGESAVAVQVFPRAVDLVDGSNTYHLWTSALIQSAMPNLKQIPRYH